MFSGYCSSNYGVSQFALTHLSELVVDQLQPGNVQVIQVIAAVALGGRRLGAALPLLPVAGQTACRLRQQPGTNTKIHAESLSCGLETQQQNLS